MGCLRGAVVKGTDCGIVISEFELHSRYFVYFRTNTHGMESYEAPYPSSNGLGFVSLLFFQSDGFGIKYPAMVDMPSNKETEESLISRAKCKCILSQKQISIDFTSTDYQDISDMS